MSTVAQKTAQEAPNTGSLGPGIRELDAPIDNHREDKQAAAEGLRAVWPASQPPPPSECFVSLSRNIGPARPQNRISESASASKRRSRACTHQCPVLFLMPCDSREEEGLILEFLYRKFFQVSFFVHLLDGHRGLLWSVSLDRMRPDHNYRHSDYDECWKYNAFYECRKCDTLHGISPSFSV
jgi:hypothetical protein